MTMRQVARLVILVTGLALAACATDPVIRTDFDRTADFSAYQSFGFAERPGTDTSGYASLLTQRLEHAIGRELTARGYVEAGRAPDLLVDFHARAQDKLRVTSVPPLLAPYPRDYGGYRRGFYDPWSGYDSYTDVQSYTEGTVSVDLIDRAHRRVVWQGIATDRSQPDADPLPPDEVDATVNAIFASFPARGAPTGTAGAPATP